MATEDELYPIHLLTEELNNHDAELRIKSIRKLKTVAQALGPERTRTELIPFLNLSIEDEDEILVILATQLGELIGYVGGVEHATCLLEPLELLAGVEETVVRDQAVESIIKVIDVLTDVTDSLVPLLKRLTEGDWFTSRVSACSLLAPAYRKTSDPASRKELVSYFQLLCNDDTPMVRRAASSNLGKFAAAVEKEVLLDDILTIFKALSTDDQDSVRLLAIENCSALALLFNDEMNRQHILPIIRRSVEDRSWRVRFSVSKDFSGLAKAMGAQIVATDLLSCYTNLLQDPEAEVRASIAKNTSGFCELIEKSIFTTDIMPLLQTFAQDTAPNVRSALSAACMQLIPCLGQEHAINHISPLLLIFLRDDVVEVRLNVLKKIDVLGDLMSNLSDSILPAVCELSKDLQWRIREAVVQAIPSLATTMGSDFFEKKLSDIYISAFTDTVSDVRTAAATSLKDIFTALGSDWLVESIIPKLEKIYSESTVYQERVNILYALRNVASEAASSALIAALIQLAIRGAQDKIPNVRFVASKTIEQLAKFADPSVVASEVRPCLAKLQEDSDDDVRYFATQAMEDIS